MRLDAYIADQLFPLQVTAEALSHGRPMFAKMDADMNRGWRMGPEYVETLDRIARAQVAADHLLTALENRNEALIQAMAAYIADRVPEARAIHIDGNGEPRNTVLLDEQGREIRS